MARIALDIDSTLHHYWDLLQRIAHERYGVDLPYEEQRDWGITVLERDAVVHCVEETHSDENIAAGVPYPDAVETVRDWHDAGPLDPRDEPPAREHATRPPRRWLERIGMPYDDLHCSFDKVTRCVELGIDVLVDDSPVNIAKRARGGHRGRDDRPSLERGDRRAADGVIGARDWGGLQGGARPGAGTPRPRRLLESAAHAGVATHNPVDPRARGAPTDGARARPTSCKAHLPGVEPERQLNDWGRSERIEGLMDRTARRLLLPLLVPRRGGGDRERAGHRRRAARLEPLAARCRPTRR